MSEEELLRELDEKLRQLSVEGLWSQASEADMATYSKDPHTTVLPHVWKWQDLYDAIQTVGNMHGLDGKAERRVLRLINPAYQGRQEQTTTHHDAHHADDHAAAEARRGGPRSSAQLRGVPFHTQRQRSLHDCRRRKNSYGGGRLDSYSFDDVAWTPERRRTGVWLDGLDNPLLFLLQAITWEAFPGGLQPIKNDADCVAPRVGMARPVWEKSPERPSYNLHYKWKDTYETLKRLSDGPGSPFDGVALEYVNPAGGHTMPTLSCGIQMLRRGETTQTHRHNSSTIYHAFRGSGTTVINGEKFDWEQGDCFVVPLWSWHSHQNRSKKEEAILFSTSDRPVMEALKLYREEPGEGGNNH